MISKNQVINKNFFQDNQRLLELFFFFSIFPIIKIGGISLTLFIFLILAYRFRKQGLKLFRLTTIADIFLLLFLFFVLLSGLQMEETYRERSIIHIFKINFQYIYWVIVALFIKTWIYSFDFYKISRSVFFALIIAVIYFKTANEYYVVYYPNVFAYVLVLTYPIAAYYILKRFKLFFFVAFSIIFILSVMLAGSRTGFALIILEFILLIALGNSIHKKLTLVFLVSSIPFIMFYSLQFDIETFKYDIADSIEPYSPKIARGIRISDRLQEIDKSLLTRELMIEKGKIIFEEHPFFGVGPGNFTYYGADINPGAISEHLHRTVDSYNKTSSQNSFLMILSESGIFALTCILIIFVMILWRGLYYLFSFNDNVKLNIYYSFTTVLIYSVILVTTSGTLAWIFIGLSMTILERRKILS
jgi:O-antigen ligase